MTTTGFQIEIAGMPAIKVANAKAAWELLRAAQQDAGAASAPRQAQPNQAAATAPDENADESPSRFSVLFSEDPRTRLFLEMLKEERAGYLREDIHTRLYPDEERLTVSRVYRAIARVATRSGLQPVEIVRRKKEGRKMRYMPGKRLRDTDIDEL